MEIWVVRHGQTEGNLAKIIQGHSDGKLTQLGIDQAIATGESLANEKFDKVFVSDVGRTKETFANLIQMNKHIDSTPVTFNALLREKGGGVLEGEKLSKFTSSSKAHNIPIREYKAKGGESWSDVLSRVKAFLIKLSNLGFRGQIENLFDKPEELRKVLVVTHGGWVMELFNYIELKSSGKEPSLNNVIKNCSINIIKMYCSNTGEICDDDCKEDDCLAFEVIKKNDVEHILNMKTKQKKAPNTTSVKSSFGTSRTFKSSKSTFRKKEVKGKSGAKQ